GPLVPLLGTAFNQVQKGNTPADVQSAHALGAVELVGGQAEHINVLGLHINGQMPHRLNGIGVEYHPGLLADFADFRNGQNRADFVVGVHGGNEARVLPDGVLYLLGLHIVPLFHGQQGDLKAFLFQLFQGVKHGVVLKSGGNDVLFALLGSGVGGGENGLVVGFAAAGGEVNFSCFTAQALGHPAAGVLQNLLGLLADGV